jgi:hypothetical protein
MYANTFCDVYTNIRIWVFPISACLKGNVNPAQEADWWCKPRGKPLPLGELPVDAKPDVESPDVFTDADYGNDKDSRRSISGMVTPWYGPIAWQSKNQSIVTTSTCEAELVAAAASCKKGLWLRKLLSEPLMHSIQIQQLCDNDATIALIKNETA